MRRSVLTGTFLVLCLVVMVTPAYSQGGPLSGYKICLDPGHGGSDPGAVKSDPYLEEKDINLDVAFGLKTILELDGAEVVLTRTDDTFYENSDRYTFCNAEEADILVSVHTNSVLDVTWDGTYVLHSPKSSEDRLLAQALHDAMFPFLRDLRPEGVPYDDFRDFGLDRFASGVLFKSDMPAAMIEPLFMSNKYEAPVLVTTVNEEDGDGVVELDGDDSTPNPECADLSCRRGQIVQSVREGILDYFDSGSANQPPVALFDAACVELDCEFSASASYDPEDGDLSYEWDFGDGIPVSEVEPSYSFPQAGEYEVVLTVTDDAGATGTARETINAGFWLSAAITKVKRTRTVNLKWGGTKADSVDIYQNGEQIATSVSTSEGAYAYDLEARGTYAYLLGEAGTTVCSNVATVVY